MNLASVHLADEAATARFGEDLALALQPGDVVLLSGDLGAGKSALARAVLRTLADDPTLEVPSPTFTLVQSYGGRLPAWHVDLYRLDCTRKLFVAAGMSDAEAKSRSLLLYACVFGLSLMHYGHFDDNLADLKQRIADRIVGT